MRLHYGFKPRARERQLLQWAGDCYFALRAAGFDPAAAGRILIEVLRDKLSQPSPTHQLTESTEHMGLKAPVTGNGEAREIPAEGNYLAVCNGVYMLGTQPGFNGGDPHAQLMLSFELHKRRGPVTDSQGRPMETSAIMNHTFNIKSTLCQYAGVLRGKDYTEDELEAVKKDGGFDPESLLGLSCRLSLKHRKSGDKTRDKVDSISRLDPEDDKPPVGVTDEVYWDWTLGRECPKRIGYFWERAQENPDRKVETVSAGASAVAPTPDDDDAPPF